MKLSYTVGFVVECIWVLNTSAKTDFTIKNTKEGLKESAHVGVCVSAHVWSCNVNDPYCVFS